MTRPHAYTADDRTRRPAPDLVRRYWNARLHDQEMASSPVGSAAFFHELEQYRFEKLDYLPRLIDFESYRGHRVLEIGCGLATDLARFARGGAHVTGVDLADTSLALARKNFEWLALQGDFCLADGARLPFRDALFDFVYCHGVLQYAADPERIVGEADRVLRRGGDAVFMVYNRRSWLAWMSRFFGVPLEHADAPVFRLYNAAEFDSLLRPFPQRRLVAERFPAPTRLHRGPKAVLYNSLLVPAFRLLPRAWVRPLGWHLMAFVTKA